MRRSYLLLGLGVTAACGGAFVGATSGGVMSYYFGWSGWVAALAALFAAPALASACRRPHPLLGLAALIGDGFLAGVVLGPALAVGNFAAGGNTNIIRNAAPLALAVYFGIAPVVLFSRRKFSAKLGLTTGVIVAVAATIALAFFLPLANLASLTLLGSFGVFGAVLLVRSIGRMLRKPAVDRAVAGALTLFAGVFGVFQIRDRRDV